MIEKNILKTKKSEKSTLVLFRLLEYNLYVKLGHTVNTEISSKSGLLWQWQIPQKDR